MSTKIEWCDETWNPITGCTPISEGCKHCYAERMAKRLRGRFGYPKDYPFKPGTVHDDKFDQPSHWKRSRRIFVCSMGDLFHDYVKADDIEKVFEYMRDESQHIYVLLTKRPDNVRKFWNWRSNEWLSPNQHSVWPKHVWLGVTAENQKQANRRIPILLESPATVKFVSVEPMLEWMDLANIYSSCLFDKFSIGKCEFELPGIDWVICGKETGVGARPINPDWIRDLRDQCSMAEIPFFYKNGFIDGRKWEAFPKEQS